MHSVSMPNSSLAIFAPSRAFLKGIPKPVINTFASFIASMAAWVSSQVRAAQALSPSTMVFRPSSSTMIRPVPVETEWSRYIKVVSTPDSLIHWSPMSPHGS